MKTAFCSVIFPANLIYFNDFLHSLENQTDTHFDLLLFNDGIENLHDLLMSTSLKYEINEVEGSPSEIRAEVFRHLKMSNYDTIIFGDTDDYFSVNRVEDCKKKLESVDIIANDLILVDNDKNEISGPYWASRIELKEAISVGSIKHHNFLGLGNTAIKKKVLPTQVHFEPNLIAIDWYFYTVLLQNSWKVGFSFTSFTYYRQHQTNIVGRKNLTYQAYVRGFNVKLNHYISLSKDYPDFCDLAATFAESKQNISENKYKKIIEKNIIQNPFWWEEIQL